MKKSFRFFWMGLGFLCLGLGSLGIVLPVLPTFPFYLATAYCFAKSSERLQAWFEGTKLYQKHFASFAKDRSMDKNTKIITMLSISLVMIIAFYFMKNVFYARVILFFVWLVHMLYFLFRVKTKAPEKNKA